MRRSVVSLLLVAGLAAPGTAHADVLSELQSLAERDLQPAPLVPTTAPPSLRPLDETIQGSGSRRRTGYGLRLVHYTSTGPDAIIALEGGSFISVRDALRDSRRLGFRAIVEWGAHCFAADGTPTMDYGGSARLTLMRRAGAAFRAEIASGGWTGSVEGTVNADSVDATVRATRTVDGATCDTGLVAFTARPIAS